MKERPFWTAYRKLYAAEHLAKGESVTLVGARLGVSRKKMQTAIQTHGLRDPKWLLGPEATP